VNKYTFWFGIIALLIIIGMMNPSHPSAWIHHGSSSRERVGARGYPSDLGEYG